MASGARLRLRPASSAPCAFGFSARPPAGGSRSGTAIARRARRRGSACAARPRTQSSLAIRGREGPWFLVNASPDARQQLEQLSAGAGSTASALPPIAGVLLTDAEIDHTAGLLLLRESAAPVRIFGDARRRARAEARVSGAGDPRALLRGRVADAGTGAARRRCQDRVSSSSRFTWAAMHRAT